MKLLEMYVALQNGDLTTAQAAHALGIEERALKIRIARHGLRLPMVLGVLDQIHEGKLTRPQAAATLQVTPRTVNVLMKSWGADRPLAKDPLTWATSQVKWEARKKFALDLIRGTLNLDQASDAASVSTRQMRRWVSELIGRHHGMVYKDLAKIAPHRLREIANEIAEEENLADLARRTADAISDGETTEADEALRRLSEARVLKRKKAS